MNIFQSANFVLFSINSLHTLYSLYSLYSLYTLHTLYSLHSISMGFVSLKVFDVQGKEVKTLVNEIKPAGFYEIVFDGSNLASGIYFYKLEAGSFVQTKRMLLLK